MSTDYTNRFCLPSKEEQFSLIGLIVLDKMINKNRVFSTMLEGDDIHLQEFFDFFNNNQIFDINIEEGCYEVSNKGKRLYKTFLQRYEEYLKIYDIFCAVDLEEGKFAFEKINELDDHLFADYINQDCFHDLRVTVLEFKNRAKQTINPMEIVFISFLIEKRFREPKDRNEVLGRESWQYFTTCGDVFREIVEICNNAPHWEELGYEDDQGEVSGEDVIADVIEQAAHLGKELDQQRADQDREYRETQQQEELDDEPEIIETTTYHDYGGYYDPYYYDPYYDPYYVSPIWDLALLAIIL